MKTSEETVRTFIKILLSDFKNLSQKIDAKFSKVSALSTTAISSPHTTGEQNVRNYYILPAGSERMVSTN
ncbi:hypothetical protein ACLKA7_017129 [Drosophila subpalustris]